MQKIIDKFKNIKTMIDVVCNIPDEADDKKISSLAEQLNIIKKGVDRATADLLKTVQDYYSKATRRRIGSMITEAVKLQNSVNAISKDFKKDRAEIVYFRTSDKAFFESLIKDIVGKIMGLRKIIDDIIGYANQLTITVKGERVTDKTGRVYALTFYKSRDNWITRDKSYVAEKKRGIVHNAILSAVNIVRSWVNNHESLPEGEFSLPRGGSLRNYPGGLNGVVVGNSRAIFYLFRKGNEIQIRFCEYITETAHNNAVNHPKRLERYTKILNGAIRRDFYRIDMWETYADVDKVA